MYKQAHSNIIKKNNNNKNVKNNYTYSLVYLLHMCAQTLVSKVSPNSYSKFSNI